MECSLFQSNMAGQMHQSGLDNNILAMLALELLTTKVLQQGLEQKSWIFS